MMELMDRILSRTKQQTVSVSPGPRSMVESGEVEQRDDPSAEYNGIMDLDMFRATLVWPQLLRCIIIIQLNTSDQ